MKGRLPRKSVAIRRQLGRSDGGLPSLALKSTQLVCMLCYRPRTLHDTSGETIHMMTQRDGNVEHHMSFEVDELTKEVEGGQFVARPVFSLSGALRAYYEWRYCNDPNHDLLLRSSPAFNLMLVVGELYDEGHLTTEMVCLNEKVKGHHPGAEYIQSLHDLRQNLAREPENLSDETLGKVVVLAIQASLLDEKGTDIWIHMHGLSTIVCMRGSRNFCTTKAAYLIRACRIVMLFTDMFDGRESCFATASWSHGIGHQADPTDLDILVDIMVAATVLLKKLNTYHTDQDEPALQAVGFDILTRLSNWCTQLSKQTNRAVCDQPVHSSNCPFQSFMGFVDPISAEVYMTYHTILLVFADISSLHPILQRVRPDTPMGLPRLDAFHLACHVSRMVPYFLAGGVLGYFIIDFPARFALRCFRRLGAVRYEKWLSDSLSQVRMASLEATDYFHENPRRLYCHY